VDIVPAFIPHAQAPLLIDPRVGALHHPAVPPQPLLRLDAGSCDAGSDAASAQASAVLVRRVRLVRMQLAGPMPAASVGLFTSGTASNSGNSSWVSWTLAPVRLSARGRPFPSTRR
jgi:hypothetical protein